MAAVLLLVFLYAIVVIVRTANSPPLLADPAPTAPPVLLCPQNLASSDGATTPGDVTTSPTSEPAATNDETEGPTADVGSDTRVTCAAAEALYAPQYRGGYDPNTRLMALLAVITPLMTTIVAFYFGQRAGAGAGEAEKQKIIAQVAGVETDAEFSEFRNELIRKNKLGRTD